MIEPDPVTSGFWQVLASARVGVARTTAKSLSRYEFSTLSVEVYHSGGCGQSYQGCKCRCLGKVGSSSAQDTDDGCINLCKYLCRPADE